MPPFGLRVGSLGLSRLRGNCCCHSLGAGGWTSQCAPGILLGSPTKRIWRCKSGLGSRHCSLRLLHSRGLAGIGGELSLVATALSSSRLSNGHFGRSVMPARQWLQKASSTASWHSSICRTNRLANLLATKGVCLCCLFSIKAADPCIGRESQRGEIRQTGSFYGRFAWSMRKRATFKSVL